MSTPIQATQGNTFLQYVTTGEVLSFGDVTCTMPTPDVEPPRVAVGPDRWWVFGALCDPKLKLVHGDNREGWQMPGVPQPEFFDKPVVAAATNRLIFGGEYRGRGEPWPSDLVIGVVGAFDPAGQMRFRVDVEGTPALNRDTEVTGVAATASGDVVWAIGNYANAGVTLTGVSFERPLAHSCAPETPCKPFITRLSIENP